MSLQLDKVSYAYGDTQVLRDVSFELEEGAIGCLLGASGSGKTTALRCIAGFESIQTGAIWLAGRRLSDGSVHLPPEKRRIGMVFQDYCLLPHLNISNNIAFGLSAVPVKDRRKRVDELLALVGLAHAATALPYELSGGEQQRVALARALAPKPDVLLLDEPFSSLDVELRQRLSIEVRDILKEQNTTALLVTHHQLEAFAMADHIGVLDDGGLQQWDTAYNLYHLPKSRQVANFVGRGVFLPGEVIGKDRVRVELGELTGELEGNFSIGSQVDVLLRPDDILHDDESALTARVDYKAFQGADILYTLKLKSGEKIYSLVPSHHNHEIGEPIGIRLEVDHIVAFSSTRETLEA